MNKIENIGIAEHKVSKAPEILASYGLGSCIGAFLYDRTTKIGGLAHVMLPSSGQVLDDKPINRKKFIDTAIPDMLDEMTVKGANKSTVIAKIAGGANMFSMDVAWAQIGEQNIGAIKNKLTELNIPLVSEDVGECYGRSIFVDLDTGKVKIRALGRQFDYIEI